MTQKNTFFPFQGGLDLATAAIAMPSGRAIACLNYEPAVNGYKRLTGYERFDGRTSPTDAYNAAAAGSEQADMDAARAAITEIPGSGPVRGFWFYDGEYYGFRDNAGGTAGAMYRASAAGWVAVSFGRTVDFTSGGTTEITEGITITGATSGATASVRRVVLQSGTWSGGDAAGYLVLASQSGTFQAENLNIGATLNVATIAGNSSTITLPAGGRYEFVNHNFYGSADLKRMYGVNGVGPAFEFDGTTFTPIITGTPGEAPHRIGVHRMHLVLGFPGGNIVGSQPGEPLLYDAALGAFTFGIGDEITDFISANATVFTILGRNGVFNLIGNDATDFVLETLSDEAGALPWTAEKMGSPIYMDNRGVRSLTATQAFGNFNIGTLTQLVRPWLQDKAASGVTPVAAVRVRGKDLYRLFFSDNSGLSIFLGKKNPEILPFDLGKLATCTCSIEDEDGNERVFFGSDDGFVYEMDRGRSFDGSAISYFLRLPFIHMGAPQVVKRWHRAVIECEAIPQASLSVSADFDYGDSFELGLPAIATPTSLFTVQGGGGLWDISNWDQFYWSAQLEGIAEAYLDGVGRNMSLLIAGETADEPPHLLHGITIYYSVRGLDR